MLLWMSSLIFYFSYLFSVFFLSLLVVFMSMIYFSSMLYVKFLIVLVYVSGVVIFILYISCMCWYIQSKFNYSLLILGSFIVYQYDSGYYVNFDGVGSFLWMYLLIGLLFNSLVMIYSLNLFKVSGSLRF